MSGLGGIVVLPVAIPANIASVIYVQMRMNASIAHISQSVTELTKQTGIQIGLKVGQAQIKRIPGAVLTKINQRVGFRWVTKFGEKGIINLGKMVPLLGEVIRGSVDAVSTKVIASAAQKTFKPGGYDNSSKVVLEI